MRSHRNRRLLFRVPRSRFRVRRVPGSRDDPPSRAGASARQAMKVSAIDIALAKKVLQTEAAAILALVDRLDERFEQAIHLLLECRGRVIVTGMGKSGI